MNFIEAVTALKEGKCEEIRIDECFYRLAPSTKVIVNSLTLTPIALSSTNFLSENWELVNPKPQYEEIEVKRWFWKNVASGAEGICEEKPNYPLCNVVELRGMFKREIKPKVKHREKITGRGLLYADQFSSNAKVFVEWEE